MLRGVAALDLLTFDAQVTLRGILAVLRAMPESEFTQSALTTQLRDFATRTGRSIRDVMPPLRVALCGSDNSIDLCLIMSALGKAESCARVDWPFVIGAWLDKPMN